MTFHFSHIGPMKEAELELGNLTIIAGRNNTGKTYLVYTLYGFLQSWMGWPGIERYFLDQANASAVNVGHVGMRLMEEGQCRCAIDHKRLKKDRQAAISNLAHEFSDVQLSNVFSSSRRNFKDASIRVSFESDFPRTSFRHELNYLKETSVLIEYNGEHLIFSIKQLGKRRLEEDDVTSLISFGYMQFLLAELPNPFILSAERFGISLFYKELDFTKNRLVELLQKMGEKKEKDRISPFMLIEKGASRYALPIKDNIDYTRSISDFVNKKGNLEDEKLYDDVKNIMDGYYRSDENEIRFVSKARKTHRFDIPLHLASSSARGLSDLYFYLRHKAKPNQLLIIDEPESHLDTNNQIMLARMLSHFIRSGIKVLITTHSDYVLKEINNLVMLSSFADDDEFIKSLKYKKDECLPPESLRCYVAENGQLTRCNVDRFGVDMPVFDKTIDAINRVSNMLASRLKDTGQNADRNGVCPSRIDVKNYNPQVSISDKMKQLPHRTFNSPREDPQRAVKIVDDRGAESLKVIQITQAERG